MSNILSNSIRVKFTNVIHLIIVASVMSLFCVLHADAQQLSYKFDKKRGSLDIGGKYAGLQFRRSRPLPSSINFFYPVGMSIDLAKDSLHRDESLPYAIGVQAGDAPRKWIGHEPWVYEAGPHTATFTRREGELDYTLRYNFADELPGFMVFFIVKNHAAKSLPLTIYTHLRAPVRPNAGTTQFDNANTEYDPDFQYAWIRFEEGEAHKPCVIAQSVSDPPTDWTLSPADLVPSDTGSSNWLTHTGPLGKHNTTDAKAPAFVAFEYKQEIAAGDSFVLAQAYWAGQQADRREGSSKFQRGWATDLATYGTMVDSMGLHQSVFSTGDHSFDKTVQWAKGVVAANQHFIGNIVEPAASASEALWYSSREVTIATFGSIPYDVNNSFNTLRFMSDHATEDSLIPLSIYWEDEGYVLTYPPGDDWTHPWFVSANAAYLRHSSDTNSVSRWYRLVVRSIDTMLTFRGPDNLMHSSTIDWWGTGTANGPSVIGTALAIRALRDYCFLTSVLLRDASKMPHYEAIADSMEAALNATLWDNTQGYYFGGTSKGKDGHYYSGALLVPWLGLADQTVSSRLAATAGKQLFRAPLGVMNVAPADFPADSGVGAPYMLYNGGVWGQTNAWYAMAQHAAGRADDALKTLSSTMTLDAVVKSPLGVPGMYKYRAADPKSPLYGEIENTSYTTSASWFLSAAYTIAGFSENEWNLGFSGAPPAAWKSVNCSYTFGLSHKVTLTGKGSRLRSFTADGVAVPSMVMPVEIMTSQVLKAEFGQPKAPYLEKVNAVLHHIMLDHKKLTLEISSFAGHTVNAVFVAPGVARHATVNGINVELKTSTAKDGLKIATLEFKGTEARQTVVVEY